MTDKELLYVKDTADHLKHFEDVCEEAKAHVSDERLKGLLEGVKKEACNAKTSFTTLLKRYGG